MCGAELHSLPEGVQRVSRMLQDAGHPHSPRMLDDACRTAQPPVVELAPNHRVRCIHTDAAAAIAPVLVA